MDEYVVLTLKIQIEIQTFCLHGSIKVKPCQKDIVSLHFGEAGVRSLIQS